MALHTLSHLLIRRIAMECGYSSASLAERIYIGTEEEPQAGVLLYTAAPDSEGTRGGLVALAEPPTLSRLVHGALEGTRAAAEAGNAASARREDQAARERSADEREREANQRGRSRRQRRVVGAVGGESLTPRGSR